MISKLLGKPQGSNREVMTHGHTGVTDSHAPGSKHQLVLAHTRPYAHKHITQTAATAHPETTCRQGTTKHAYDTQTTLKDQTQGIEAVHSVGCHAVHAAAQLHPTHSAANSSSARVTPVLTAQPAPGEQAA
jgi:hypothetical protein